MKKTNLLRMCKSTFVIILLCGNLNLTGQDISIPVNTDKLIKKGYVSWKLSNANLIKLYNRSKGEKVFSINNTGQIKPMDIANIDSLFHDAFISKSLKSLSIPIQSKNKGFMGNLVVFRKRKNVLPGKTTTNNNVKIVLDASSNDLTIISPDSKPRKSLYIRHNEVVSFEIDNINLLKYKYTLNHAVVTYNVDFDDVTSGGGTSAFAAWATCADKIKFIKDLQKEVSDKKTDIIAEDCIDREDLKSFINNKKSTLNASFAISDFNNLVSDVEEFFKQANCTHNAVIANDLMFDATNVNVTGLKETFKATIESLKKDLADLFTIYETRKITSLPQYIKGQNADIIRYTVKKEAAEGNSFSGTTGEVNYDIEIRRGFKIDVSAGLFLTGLNDEKYNLRDTAINDTTTHKLIIEDKGNAASLSIGSLVNLNYRIGNNLSAGMSVGAAIPFKEDKTPQVLAGLNFLIGREQRLGLTGGMVYGPYSTLKNGYESGKAYDIPDNDAPMTTINEISWFAGIVYNLGKTKILDK